MKIEYINNDYYEIKENTDGKYCIFGNLTSGEICQKCKLDCKKYHYEYIINPLYIIKNKVNELINIVKNTNVSDITSYEEKNMILYCLKDVNNKSKKEYIENNRILFNKTFAIRTYYFLKDLFPDTEEEQKILTDAIEYIKKVFNFQLKTCSREDEIEYMKNIGYIDNDNNKIYL